MPERHLGLVQAEEHADLSAILGALARMAEAHLDLPGILERVGEQVVLVRGHGAGVGPTKLRPPLAGVAEPPAPQRRAFFSNEYGNR